jgi:hypothetical protein
MRMYTIHTFVHLFYFNQIGQFGFCVAKGKPLHKCYYNGFHMNDESFYTLLLTENTKKIMLLLGKT